MRNREEPKRDGKDGWTQRIAPRVASRRVARKEGEERDAEERGVGSNVEGGEDGIEDARSERNAGARGRR